MNRRTLIVLTIGVCAGFQGCGPRVATGERVDTVPASGILLFKGEPLPGFQVTVMPTSAPRVAIGISDAEGKFVLGTNGSGDGCPTGMCKVAVVWNPSTGEPENAGSEQIIDDPRKLPKAPVEIPKKYSNPETSGLFIEVPPGGTKDLKIELE